MITTRDRRLADAWRGFGAEVTERETALGLPYWQINEHISLPRPDGRPDRKARKARAAQSATPAAPATPRTNNAPQASVVLPLADGAERYMKRTRVANWLPQ